MAQVKRNTECHFLGMEQAKNGVHKKRHKVRQENIERSTLTLKHNLSFILSFSCSPSPSHMEMAVSGIKYVKLAL